MSGVPYSPAVRVGKVLVVLGLIGQWSMTIIGLGTGAFFVTIASVGEAPLTMALVGGVYLLAGGAFLAGAVMGQRSLSALAEGDMHRAGVRGVVASFLLPVNLLILIGSVLYLTAPETKVGASPPADAWTTME